MKSKLLKGFSLLTLLLNNTKKNEAGSYFTTGTSIVAYISAEEIFIGSDSKQVTKYTGNGISHSDQVTKIHNYKNIWFAIAGLSGYDDKKLKKGSFNPVEDMNKLLKVSNTSEIAIDQFKNQTLTKLNVILKDAFSSSTHDYFAELSGKIVFEMLITGFKNGQPLIGYFKIGLTGTKQNWKLDLSNQFIFIPQPNAEFRMLGSINSIRNFYVGGLNFPYGINTPQDKVKHLISLEIQNNSADCGGPIKIVKINKNGSFSWLQ